MKIGISTASLYPLETEKALTFLGEKGISVTEIFFNSPTELSDNFISELNAIKQHYGIDIVSIHPCGSLIEPYLLFSEYKRRFYDGFEMYKRYYEVAQKLGAKTVVIHGDSLKGHIPMNEYCERLVMMNNEAKKYNCSISQENVNKYRGATPKNICEIKRLTNGEIKFIFDIKQSIRDGCGVDAMYSAMKGNIVNVHYSDHSQKGDCLLPGKGDFDFEAFFNRLKHDEFNGACLLEVYSNAYKDVEELVKTYRIVK